MAIRSRTAALNCLHGELEITIYFLPENIGRRIDQVYPHLHGYSRLVCRSHCLEIIKRDCQAAFMALPHGLSVPMVMELNKAGVKCIDLGADFRLKDAAIYERYYETVHEAPFIGEAVYGLPELYRRR